MTRIPSIYNRIWYGMLLFCLACGTGMSCADDYFAESGSVGKMATLHIELPKIGTGDSQVLSARFIAFQTGGGGTSSVLQVNKNISASTENVLMPIGNSNIYILANVPEALGLASIKDEKSLMDKMATWEQAKTLPHIMVGSYHNVSVGKDGVKDSKGNTVHVGKSLQRLISKVTVQLEYESMGGTDIVIDSVTVVNRASHSALSPKTFGGHTFVPSAIDFVKDLRQASITGNATTYHPLEFYLSEYLVDAAHADKSTCLYIHAHREGTNEHLSYPVYIGDWFGQGYTYEQFRASATPGELVGTTGLSVTRNKHYTLTCKLKGEEQTGVKLTTSVKDWEIVYITGDVVDPYFNVSKTSLMVNPLKAEGARLDYISSISKDSITVQIIDNPENRFSSIVSDNSIHFIHSNLNVARITTDAGLPITGKAIITARDGKTKISKTITLGVFNPISRFYMRGTGDVDYGGISPSTTEVDKAWSMDWASAMGYDNPYHGSTTSLHGDNPNSTIMNGAAPDSYSGCSGYWEDSRTDRNKGRGVWRLPSGDGGENSEASRLLELLKSLDNTVLNFDVTSQSSIWSSSEAAAAKAYIVTYANGALQSQDKTQSFVVRCVRDVDNTNVEGGASYLNVSHNRYEVGPMPYRTVLGAAPLYYESDAPVTISLLDENGNDISNMNSGIPFIGFTAETEDALYDKGNEPPIAFPHSHATQLNKGYFLLHGTKYANIPEIRTSLGDLNGPTPAALRKKKYILQFTVGNLSKTVPIDFVESMAVKDIAILPLPEAMGVSALYSGYDYIQRRRLTVNDPKEIEINMPVSDTTTGCGGYYEGSVDDPVTGVGNWFVSNTIFYLGSLYVASGSPGSGNIIDFYGGNIDPFISWNNNRYWYYWSTLSDDYYTYKHFTTIITTGAISSSNKKLGESHYVRCERRLNADILTLSSQSIVLTPGSSAEIIYYTDALRLASLTNEDILYISGTNPAFTTTTTTTGNAGKIIVNCIDTAQSGSEANLLVHTVGRSKRAETYKIIKLKVK